MARFLSFMLEKWFKKSANKAADSAIEGVKESLNDKIDKYGDYIQAGLVLAVIIFGGRHLTRKTPADYMPPIHARLPAGTGQPIIINNYYTRDKEEAKYYGRQKQQRKMD